MIKKLDNTDITISKKIHAVFQVSYAVEAKLLKVNDFPPLKRKPDSFIKSDNDFFGYIKNGEIAGVIEIHTDNTSTHIHSLVVHPDFFRQGIAGALIRFVFDTYYSALFMVETGVENEPAVKLYKKFGFKEVHQWTTDHGIRKVRFEKSIKNYRSVH